MSGAPSEVRVRASGQTDVGRVRKQNEDAFVIADRTSGDVGGQAVTGSVTVGEKGVLLGVSDGMGGAQAGDVAIGTPCLLKGSAGAIIHESLAIGPLTHASGGRRMLE
jgi:serine/threonine protein phosphatase PrpC